MGDIKLASLGWAMDEEPERQGYTFDFSGGVLCLDFVNTVSGSRARPRERLRTQHDLLSWARQGQILPEDALARIARAAERRPDDASGVLREALALREALFRIFAARVEGGPPEPADLVLFNAALAEALGHQRIAETADGFAWDWADAGGALGRIVWPVVRSAADLLTSVDLRRVRRCAGATCDWLFIDRSRNHTRRWCDMESCGNRAKAKRYYSRHHAHPQEPGTAV